LFEALAGRNVYLSLLAENNKALQQMIKLVAASPWISEYLAKYPILFDELLDTLVKRLIADDFLKLFSRLNTSSALR
jgi:glutamate-ammonia-ligase adenylyltransferase